MGKPVIHTALLAGAVLALAACNRHPTVNNVTTNDLSANMSMTAPANDASAMETVTNTTTTTTTNTTTNSTRDSGAGTSTNNVESNTVGM